MNCDISVEEVRPISNKGNLKAFARVRVGPFQINSCRVIQQPGQSAWVSLPQEKGKDDKYWPIIVCHDSELLNAIKEAILSVYAGMEGRL